MNIVLRAEEESEADALGGGPKNTHTLKGNIQEACMSI